MKKDERFAKVAEYVRKEMREEIRAVGHGAKRAISKALGASAVHVGNMTRDPPTRGVGIEVARAFAAYRKMTYPDLEAIACGDPPAMPASGVATKADVDALRAEVASALALRAERTVTPIDDEPLSYADRVVKIGRAIGAPQHAIDETIAQAAKGGVSKRTDQQIKAALLKIAKRDAGKAVAAPPTDADEVDALERGKGRGR